VKTLKDQQISKLKEKKKKRIINLLVNPYTYNFVVNIQNFDYLKFKIKNQNVN
jgi:hypothetical protein